MSTFPALSPELQHRWILPHGHLRIKLVFFDKKIQWLHRRFAREILLLFMLRSFENIFYKVYLVEFGFFQLSRRGDHLPILQSCHSLTPPQNSYFAEYGLYHSMIMEKRAIKIFVERTRSGDWKPRAKKNNRACVNLCLDFRTTILSVWP